MSCDPGKLALYRDDELSPESRAEIEHHLAHCADCREVLERLETSSAFVRARLGDLDPLPGEEKQNFEFSIGATF